MIQRRLPRQGLLGQVISMDSASSLRVPGSEEGNRAARAGFDAFLAAHRLAPGATWPFQVALDEVLSNIVKYASKVGGEPVQVELRMRLAEGSLEIVVVDDALAFNPLEAKAPDTTQPVETRKVGGLGLALVRKLMDVVVYERTGDRNRLLLKRRLSAA
jgi:anti-sigma regulatory factor (Ser/Thr protein kinase)